VASALNTGIKAAKGEYLSWLSHDDLYHADKIENEIKILLKLDPEKRKNTILHSNYEEMNEDSYIYNTTKFEKEYPLAKLNYPLFPIFNGMVNGCNLLIPKKCFDETGLFNEDLRYSQDYDMWFRMFPKYSLLFHSDITITSRKHKAQDSLKKDKRKDEEYDKLWIGMIKKLTKEQMKDIAGGELKFYQRTMDYLRRNHFKGASLYLENEIIKYREKNVFNFIYFYFDKIFMFLTKLVEKFYKKVRSIFKR
jgi:glycosyltransferase involved in cell wall biosynthesis